MSGLVDSGLNSSRTCCFHRISTCLCSIHSGRPNHRSASGPPAQPPGVTQAGLGRCFCSQYLDSQHIYNRTLIAEFHALSFTFPTVLILFSSARFCLSSLITDIFRNHPVHFSPPRSHDFLLPASLEWAFYCLRLLTCLFSPSPEGRGRAQLRWVDRILFFTFPCSSYIIYLGLWHTSLPTKRPAVLALERVFIAFLKS